MSYLTRFIPTAVGNAFAGPVLGRVWPVHPHGCGERGCAFSVCQHGTGSSPRLWGTRAKDGRLMLSGRFIPTAVGNAVYFRCKSRTGPVHPHGCGERAEARTRQIRPIGSSPRLWGTLKPMERSILHCRFIPTAVGNAKGKPDYSKKATVHPHGCGERQRLPARYFSPSGSSPRLWGTHCVTAGNSPFLRFIPTAVGNARLLSVRPQ